MVTMILKMSAVTLFSVLLTVIIWKCTRRTTLNLAHKLIIGLIYGLFAVLSTHFGIDYSHMMLNVRDLGPLSAGLFFDPLSGIIAGLIGGVERYVAGTYWGVGSYTRIACSVSTCLAGFVAAGMNIFIFKGKKPSATFAFFMGAVMEVFHMYAVFITHRDDMSMAFYVVRICAPPMIIFTGLGMAASSLVLKFCSGEWNGPMYKRSEEEISVSQRFQFWLFAVTLTILVLNQLFSFNMQTRTAVQSAELTLNAVSGDLRHTYEKLQETDEELENLAEETVLMQARTIAEMIRYAGGLEKIDSEFLERMREFYHILSVITVDENGQKTAAAGETPVYSALLSGVLDGRQESAVVSPSDTRVVAGVRCGDGLVQVAIDKKSLAAALKLSNLDEALSYYHVGTEGTFDIFRDSGIITQGDHRMIGLSGEERDFLRGQPEQKCFEANLFGIDSLCRLEKLDDGLTLLVQLPKAEVYADRDAQVYESAFAAIILFSVIYVLISMLVQGIVVNNLDLINASLKRITSGKLDEVVSVRNSSEFASLSNDINQTVDALKGYIDAAEKRIEQELEFARTIQDAALPKNFTFPRSDFELYATMDPAKEVGGDFYDFFFADQNKIALVIADVSGKGIPAALFMMRAKTAVRGLAESGQAPAQILYRANNTLCEGNDAEMFVTVWLGILDLITGRMQCANAGHEYPVLMRAGGDYELLKERHGPALAAMEELRFKEYEIQLNPGDRLFVYTDGIPEAINGKEEQYGTQRLVDVLNTVKDLPMAETLPIVRKDIAEFAGDTDQFDDITMLGFTYYG